MRSAPSCASSQGSGTSCGFWRPSRIATSSSVSVTTCVTSPEAARASVCSAAAMSAADHCMVGCWVTRRGLR
ncbi:Uncharacterised protein [Mycobacteroides abscessus]|nr:Uncharacterised protein [Mycobacteroides abscessus]